MLYIYREPCSSLAVWKGVVVAAYGNGQIKLYNISSGKLGACVNAHARWINALDVAPDTGLVCSTVVTLQYYSIQELNICL